MGENKECISSYYNKIAELHEKVPDLRIGQLLNNFRTYLFSKHGRDIFYIRDEDFVRILEEYIDNMEGQYYES
jgi:CRISPR/Cas system CSM-associated protein Csm2 small subunit